MRARIYIEGGGEGQINDTLFRQGWHEFFEAAGLVGRMPQPVRGRGRQRTYDLFKTAVRNPKPGELPLLLVDSEDPVRPGYTVWPHLKARDGWDQPSGASEDQAFLMVQVMETWFLADRNMLRTYFGSSLRENHIRQWPSLEEVAKLTVYQALEQATASCTKHYTKGKSPLGCSRSWTRRRSRGRARTPKRCWTA